MTPSVYLLTIVRDGPYFSRPIKKPSTWRRGNQKCINAASCPGFKTHFCSTLKVTLYFGESLVHCDESTGEINQNNVEHQIQKGLNWDFKFE